MGSKGGQRICRHAVGNWSYLRILQDARLIAVKEDNLGIYKYKNNIETGTKDCVSHQSYSPYMHEVGVHAPGCPRSDRHRDAMFL